MFVGLTSRNLKQEIATEIPIVVLAEASWSKSCRKMKGILERIEEEYIKKRNQEVKFAILNVDREYKIAERWGVRRGFKVRVPALIFIKDGIMVERVYKSITKDDLSMKMAQFVSQKPGDGITDTKYSSEFKLTTLGI